MRIQELREKSNDELNKLLRDKKARVVELEMNIASGNVKNVRELSEVKKDIAQIYTLFNERQREELQK